jgi:hypothetical protein
MKRGMLPFRPELVGLRFQDVLVRSALPVVPAVYGHVSSPQPPVEGGWGMLGNDYAGNCVAAKSCHAVQDWFWATGRPIPPFDGPTGLLNYSRMLVAQGGRPYNPDDPSTDTGLDPVAAAQYWQTTGILDASGATHKIGPFTSISDADELDLAGYLGGAADVCWALPSTAEAQFEAREVWDDTSQPPGDGHDTVLGGRNSAGNRMVVTWGRLQAFTEAYRAKYMVGGMSFASREYLLATGRTPEAIDWAQLAAYQPVIGGAA